MPSTSDRSPPRSVVACRHCGSTESAALGPLPEADVFAGQPLVPPWNGGTLHRCSRCHLGFRHPVHSEGDYEALYRAAADDVWVESGLRIDQQRVLRHIHTRGPSGRILDVGCYDGRLLSSLPAGWQKDGVEASTAAAARATHRGVRIVATHIRELADMSSAYDVICAIDVIEHVPDPFAFAAGLLRLLAPDGVLLVSSGDLDARAWRWSGGRYWYCSFPEHISFISTAWARHAAQALGVDLAAAETFAYLELGMLDRARKLWRFGRRFTAARLAPSAGVATLGSPGLFRDHVLLKMRRPASGAPHAPQGKP